MKTYQGEFKSRESIEKAFKIELAEDVNILYAWYEKSERFGYCMVVFEQQGLLFMAGGKDNYNKPYGLEEQWEPEQITLSELSQILVFEPEGYALIVENLKQYTRD